MATLDTALAVLDLLAGEPQLGVREMARRAGISKSAVQRTASRLAEADLLARDGGGYRLGLRFLDFGVLVQARNDLLGAARPALRTLARISGENTHLGVLHQAQILYVGHVEGSESNTAAFTIPPRMPCHATSLGKAILAFQDEATIADILSAPLVACSSQTITESDRLGAELKLIRKRGYALSFEELRPGLRCIGAPIRLLGSPVTAGISVSGPIQRMTRDRLRDLTQPVIEAAEEIARALQ